MNGRMRHPAIVLAFSACLAWGSAAAASTETIVMIRHAEKPAGGLGQLSCQGLNRALALPAMLEGAFGTPDAIYAPDPADAKRDDGVQYDYVRPLATIEPTAIAAGRPVDASIGGSHDGALQQALQAPALHGAVVFVAWEHHAIVTVTRALLAAHGGEPTVVPDWPAADFDRIYVVRLHWQGGVGRATFELRAEGLDGQSTACPAAAVVPAATAAALRAAVADGRRSPAFIARDSARHPAAELAFFGLRPDMTVVEVEPGAGYWTELLAPYLHAHGTYYVALPSDTGEVRDNADFRAKITADPTRFGKVRLTAVGAGQSVVAPPGTADAVLTFRNLHNWMNAGYAPQAMRAFYTALKPGGVLGMEEHRGPTDIAQDPRAASGYVRQDYAIALAQAAGFKLAASSELLANPRDTKNYPQGVWTLPPNFARGAADHAKYAAIGEADNFLLLFRKP